MANSISISGTGRVTVGSSTDTLDISFTVATTGSNDIAISQTIAMGSWQPLVTGSVTDQRILIATNESTGSIKIARDSSGTNIATILYPGDSAVLPWSASANSIGTTVLYAQAFISQSLLQYVIAGS